MNEVNETNIVLGNSMVPPFPPDTKSVRFGMGCFWGAERLFWDTQGIYVTAVGYAGGALSNPTYSQVCTGATGHAEVVQVVYWPQVVEFDNLLKIFWENHDPTEYMRQGNDIGTQYRSAIFCDDDTDLLIANESRDNYQLSLTQAGYGQITTEIVINRDFWLAENEHQQYLAKHPAGYCNHGFCQVSYD